MAAQQWPTTAPTVSPGTHDPVATQAYQAGGGDYFRSGYYSLGIYTGIGFSNVNMTLGTVLARPFRVPARRSFDRLGVNVTTLNAAGTLTLAVYDTQNGIPANRLFVSSAFSGSPAGAKEEAIAMDLGPGLYWLAVLNLAGIVGISCINSGENNLPEIGLTVTPPSAGAAAYTMTGQTSMPATFTISGTTQTCPVVSLRAA